MSDKEITLFNKAISIHRALIASGGQPNTNHQPYRYGNDVLFQEYKFPYTDGMIYTVSIRLDANGIPSVFTPEGAVLHTAFDCYRHFGCSGDYYSALNWQNDLRFSTIPNVIPTIDIDKILDNTSSDFMNLSLPDCIQNPFSLTKKTSEHLGKVCHIPASTAMIGVLTGFSAASSTRFNVAFPDGNTIPIGMFNLSEQPSGTNKSRLQNAITAPITKKIQLRCKNLNVLIEDLTEELSLLDNNDKSIKVKQKQIRKLERKLKAISNFQPVTNATPEALEEVLKATNGIFSAIASEQGLINSLIGLNYGKKANNNDILLNAKEGGSIRSNRVGRQGYSGYCSGVVFCFAQEGTILKMIEASNVSGLFERFLVIAELDRVGQRDHLNSTLPDQLLLEAYEQQFHFFDQVLDDGFDEEKLITLHITSSDWKMIHHFENQLEIQLQAGAKFSHPIMRRFISKTKMHVMSLACNLFLLDNQAPTESCHVPTEYVTSAIWMMDQLIDALYTYCSAKGIISNNDQIKFIFDLFAKHERLTMHEIKKKCEAVHPFKTLPSVRKIIEEIVYFLASHHVLLIADYKTRRYVKNPLIQ